MHGVLDDLDDEYAGNDEGQPDGDEAHGPERAERKPLSWHEARRPFLITVAAIAALVIAVLSGAGAWVFGRPFLTSWFRYADVPILGRVPLASAVLFDLGVVVLVVGATVLTLVALAHQSLRKPKQRDAEEGEPS